MCLYFLDEGHGGTSHPNDLCKSRWIINFKNRNTCSCRSLLQNKSKILAADVGGTSWDLPGCVLKVLQCSAREPTEWECAGTALYSIATGSRPSSHVIVWLLISLIWIFGRICCLLINSWRLARISNYQDFALFYRVCMCIM